MDENHFRDLEGELNKTERIQRQLNNVSVEEENRIRGDSLYDDIAGINESLNRAINNFETENNNYENTEEDGGSIDSEKFDLSEQIDELKTALTAKFGRLQEQPRDLVNPYQFPKEASENELWQLAHFREKEFYSGMRKFIQADNAIRVTEETIISIQRKYKKSTNEDLPMQARQLINQLRDKMDLLREKCNELVATNPEVFVGSHLRELRNLRYDLEIGRIGKTESVQNEIKKVVEAIENSNPLFIHGYLGAGKTEIALEAAREFMNSKSDEEIEQSFQSDYQNWIKTHPNATEQERAQIRDILMKEAHSAIVISGSKHTHPSELYGHRTLSIKEFFPAERKAKLEQALGEFKKWESENQEASPDVKAMKKDGLLRVYLDDESGTFSDYFLGPIYRAMRDGRPVIIDEVDFIPHEVLASLNHILTRKVGDDISVQQNSGEQIRIKEGFTIIMTGNLPSDQDAEHYVGRAQMNAAFLSRLKKMPHDYLPQSLESDFENITPEELQKSELFQVLIAKIMDRYGNIYLPQESINKLWKLAVFTRKTEDIYSGIWADSQTGASGLTKEMIGNEVLSLRHLDRIIRAWQNDNMRFELDHYIFQEFINQAARESEKTALYQIAQNEGLFSTDSGWELSQDIEAGAGVARFQLGDPLNKADNFQWLAPRDTVEICFGMPPERTKWPTQNEEGFETNPLGERRTALLTDLLNRGELPGSVKKRLNTIITS